MLVLTCQFNRRKARPGSLEYCHDLSEMVLRQYRLQGEKRKGIGFPGSESFLKCGTVNTKIRNIPGKPILLVILEGRDNEKLDSGTRSLDGLKPKYC